MTSERSEGPEPGSDDKGAPEPSGDHLGLFDHLDVLRRRLEESPAGIDYNRLSTSGKQAALALVEADEARLSDIHGRTHVVRKGRRWVTRFLSMGSHT